MRESGPPPERFSGVERGERQDRPVAQEPVAQEPDSHARKDPLHVASLEKAFRVMGAFSSGRRDLGITEIAEATGLTKSAAQRFVHTLTALGYLERDEETRRYAPGIRLLDLGFLYLRHDALAERASPFLVAASERCGERVNLSEFDGSDIVYTFRIPKRTMGYINTVVGRRLPAFATSGGRAVLAALPEDEALRIVTQAERKALTPRTVTDVDSIMAGVADARRLGYAFTDSEILLGELAVAAAVLDHRGHPVGAVHISVSNGAWSEARVREDLAPLAMETAQTISRPGPSTRRRRE